MRFTFRVWLEAVESSLSERITQKPAGTAQCSPKYRILPGEALISGTTYASTTAYSYVVMRGTCNRQGRSPQDRMQVQWELQIVRPHPDTERLTSAPLVSLQ
jgi:hypothetical protein